MFSDDGQHDSLDVQRSRNDVQPTSEGIQPMTVSMLSDQEAAGWLDSISSDFGSIATCIKESTLPVFGGVFNFVRSTAINLVAEISQLEDLDDGRCRNSEQSKSLPLPWEIPEACNSGSEAPVFVSDRALMDLILALSMEDITFTTPYSDPKTREKQTSGEVFTMDSARKALIQRLVETDENLADARSRLLQGNGNLGVDIIVVLICLNPHFQLLVRGNSPGYQNANEVVFWRNYFHHCDETRNSFLRHRLAGKNQSHEPLESSLGTSMASSDQCSVEQEQDDSSLVPASVTDASSYNVIDSPPNSGNSFLRTLSWDDMVIVDRDSDNMDDGE